MSDPGYEASAASVLVRMISERLSADWVVHHDGPGMWRWQLDREGEPSLVVAINAREDRVLVPMHGWPAKVGPTVMAGKVNDTFASVTLPNMSDYSDARGALWILARVVPALWETEDE
jgi:hypothetical protein